jgi:formate hydrogenlyase transcriptional activator
MNLDLQHNTKRLAEEAVVYRTLLEINNAVITSLTEEDLSRAILSAIRRVTPFDWAAICPYDQQHDAFRILALEGRFASPLLAVGQMFKRQDTSAFLAYDQLQSLLQRNLEAERLSPLAHLLYAEGVRSTCMVPLIHQGQGLGVIAVGSRTTGQYSEADAEFLQEVANQVALAVANMKAYEEIKALSAREAATAERRRTLLELNNAIITNLTEETLFREICLALKRTICFDQAGLSLYEPKQEAMRIVALDGTSEDYFRLGQMLPLYDPASGLSWDFHQQHFHEDLENEGRHPIDQLICEAGIRSYILAPLIYQGESCGTLGVGSLRACRYTKEDLEFLQEVGNQIALAVANMRAHAEIKTLSAEAAALAERRRTLLEINNAIATKLTQQELCDAVFAALQRIVPYDRVGLSLFDYAEDCYRIIALGGKAQSESFAVGQRISRQENWITDQFRIGQPWFRPDLETVERNPFEQQLFNEGLRSFCAVPLLAQGKVSGAFSISSQTRNQYSEADVELLQEVANQVAIAIANMRAYEEIMALSAREAATAERRRTLLEINNAVVTQLTRDELLRVIVPAVQRVIPFNSIGITLYEPEQGGYRLAALEGGNLSGHFQVGQLIPREASDAGKFIESQQPFLLRDLKRERAKPFEEALYAEGFQSFCAVALVVQGKPIGTIGVASRRKNQYSEADAEFLQEVANQIALSLENSRLYEEMKEEATQRQRTEDMLRAITEGTAAATGLDFFRSLARHLATALQIRFTLVAECIGQIKGRVRTLAFWQGDRFGDDFEYDVADTPCKGVIEGKVCYYPSNVQNHFPNDADLRELGAESYLGVTIFDTAGQAVGHLAVMDDKAMADDPWRVSVLKTFAARAGAELERLHAELALRNALDEVESLKNRLQAENLYLQEEIRTEHNFDEIIGNSPALLAVLRQVELVAPADSTVLILGETGTGKELIARAIHDRSQRLDRPLVKVNCGAISAGLVESELFGHVKGAFTGAVDRRVGRFELANGGTLFLDEVGELPLETQVKLLRVLQEGEFEPLGGSRTVKVNVRIIAATNRNLEEAVREGRFRSDLFYRLNVFPLHVPPLRERRSDIPQLVTFFLSRFAKKFGQKVESVSQETIELLSSYPWPGNIRELQNVIERGVVLSRGPILTLGRDLLLASSPGDPVPEVNTAPPTFSPSGNGRKETSATTSSTSTQSPLALEEMERRHILTVLEQTRWVIDGERGAAKVLKLHPNTLRSRMKKLGIKRPSRERVAG